MFHSHVSRLRCQGWLAYLVSKLLSIALRQLFPLFAFYFILSNEKPFLRKSSLLLIESSCCLEAGVSEDNFATVCAALASTISRGHILPWIDVFDQGWSHLILSFIELAQVANIRSAVFKMHHLLPTDGECALTIVIVVQYYSIEDWLLVLGHMSLISMETTDVRNVHSNHQSATQLGMWMLQLFGYLLTATLQVCLTSLTSTINELVEDILVESLLILDRLHTWEFVHGLTIVQGLFWADLTQTDNFFDHLWFIINLIGKYCWQFNWFIKYLFI